ncbi:MAG: NAD-glutamate dehydrogenase [Alphaproteobacteria bacterium]
MDQDERKKLIAAVRRRLTSGKADQHVKDLAPVLFLDANMEDLAADSITEATALVQSTAELIAKRPSGTHKIRLTDFEVAGQSPRHASITLVEILNDNMPFIVDSVVGELEAFGAEIRLVIHPVIVVKRDAHGTLKEFYGGLAQGMQDAGTRESLIHIHIARLHDADEHEKLTRRLASLLLEVRHAVTDWRAMRGRLEQAIDDYRFGAAGFADEDREEAIAFLTWLLEDNFTLLGMREYDFIGGRSRGRLKRGNKPGLGILGDPKIRVLRRGDKAYTTTPAIRAYLMRPEPLFVTKANIRSRVHRRAYMDYVGIKLHDKAGRLAGELRVIGLFTSTAYNRSTRTIPYLHRKTERVLEIAGFDPHGHSGKALFNVLESYPRDELFQIDDQTLHDFAIAILELHQRPRTRVLVRPDRFGRYVSVIVFVPRERYNTNVRIAIGAYLAEQFDGHVSAYNPVYPGAMVLARVHFIIGRDESRALTFDQAALEAGVANLARTWSDHLRLRQLESLPEAAARADIAIYENAFPASYRDVFSAAVAMRDIEVFNRLSEAAPLAAEFHPLRTPRAAEIGLKLIHRGAPLNLSERVPILENMGFGVIAEQTYEITPSGSARFYVHDMILRRADAGEVNLERQQQPLTDCLMAVWHRRADDDGFNSLVLIAELPWRKVALIRAFGRYLQQAGTPYSQRSMWETLSRYPALANALVDLFQARFDPHAPSDRAAKAATRRISEGLEQVETLEEDRVIRRFATLMEALLRTNFYMTDEQDAAKAEIVFKFDPRAIDFLPEPRPYREIYVYAPRVEGVHLRFGEIARGGLRWSDRAQDYRTEILGLVKAQQVKNAVIVPVGAKGGFVAKWLRPGMTREAFLAEGQAAYRVFVASLLDITDNLHGETVVPPAQMMRRDGDDPYLVVAADKGTASFSDIANGIAVDHGFWLGDAFASGGSAGYDHKKMGITARGAWEAVKRHFREMDTDIQTTPFSVAGIGDMSGDVFGNGMLLSPTTRLLAAFDHRDIFIDPDPDPTLSFAERKRLFQTPRSSWQDYDRDLLSAGGGVFSRRDKSIPLTSQIRDALGLSGQRATPNIVIRAILSADVDLLWLGGIGTYVKAPEERDEDVGDRSNDALRITADAVRARVIGEGANLGLTQRARISYGLAGGRCNSDAIDNSAGVNTSDIEVNIKIALGAAVRDGRLTLPRRNRLLKSMTKDVARLALANNYRQTLAISLSQRRGMEAFGYHQRFMQMLDRAGRLDRDVEILPDDVAIAERHAAAIPLSRAELGVLLAYAKITLFEDLVASDLADDPYLSDELSRYFPAKMSARFQDTIDSHRLRREIVVTTLSNAMVNHCGATFAMQMSDRTGADPATVTRAYVVAREAFSLRSYDAAIDALDNKLSGETQLSLYQASRTLAHTRTVWFLENASLQQGVQTVINTFRPAVQDLAAGLDSVLPARLADNVARLAGQLRDQGVPDNLARQTACLPVLADAVDICTAASAAGADLLAAARVFYEVGERFHIARIEEQAGALALTDYYDGLAKERAVEILGATHRRLSESILAAGTDGDAVENWLAAAGAAATRALDAVTAITEAEDLTVSRLSVASGLLSDFCRERERG